MTSIRQHILASSLFLLSACGTRSALRVPFDVVLSEETSVVLDASDVVLEDTRPEQCVPTEERCDGIDNDCDGQIDEGLGQASCGVGACARTMNLCREGQLRRCEPGPPMPEQCNRADDDCNGLVDDLDRGGDGIPDCVRIALLGNQGAFESSDFHRWLTMNGARVHRTQTGMEPLTRETLTAFDVVLLDQLVREYSPAEARTLFNWVEAGGGLMVLSGYTNNPSDRTRPNTLLAPFGIALIDGLLNAPVRDFTRHPTNEGLTEVPFVGGFRVAILAETPEAPNLFVARLPEGPVAVAQNRGRGHVYVWGDEWVEFDSQWRSMPMVTRYWSNALRWLSLGLSR